MGRSRHAQRGASVDDLEELDIGIQAMAAIPGWCRWRSWPKRCRVDFGGVTFFSGDHLYADNTGVFFRKIRWILK
ncbi:hypothetical protein ACNKHN_22605 [Shigella flexneri]